MIKYKSQREIALMKEAGHIVALAHEEIRKAIRPGISTKELDKIAYDVITSHGAKPSFLNYNGFPASICASINEVVIHGIPSEKIILKDVAVLKNKEILPYQNGIQKISNLGNSNLGIAFFNNPCNILFVSSSVNSIYISEVTLSRKLS